MPLTFDIITIFPGMFSGVLEESILGRAIESGLVRVHLINLRDFTHDRHRTVDDRPYGGGPGMIFKPEPVFEAVESLLAEPKAPPQRTRKIILTPQGRRLVQRDLRELAKAEWIILLCGHYEGFDERIYEGLKFEEISVGDYVLTGGEIPAMVILDGVVRLLPGALGHPLSAEEESFERGLLDYPQYTRPAEFRGMRVPEVLLSGDHAKIEAWRKAEALRRTRERRADLLGKTPQPLATGEGEAESELRSERPREPAAGPHDRLEQGVGRGGEKDGGPEEDRAGGPGRERVAGVGIQESGSHGGDENHGRHSRD